MLYSELSLLRRQMEEQIRRSEEAATVERSRFDRLLSEYMQVCQALATRPSLAPPVSSRPLSLDTITQGLGLFEEVPVGNPEGYSGEELDIGSAYQERPA
jgi:hypothetical protein